MARFVAANCHVSLYWSPVLDPKCRMQRTGHEINLTLTKPRKLKQRVTQHVYKGEHDKEYRQTRGKGAKWRHLVRKAELNPSWIEHNAHETRNYQNKTGNEHLTDPHTWTLHRNKKQILGLNLLHTCLFDTWHWGLSTDKTREDTGTDEGKNKRAPKA